VWTVLPSAPCVFAPLLALLVFRRGSPPPAKVIALGAGAGLAALLLLLPPLLHDFDALRHKGGKHSPVWGTFARMFDLYAGSPLALPKILWLQGLVLGAILLAVRAPFVAAALGITTAALLAAVFVTRPEMSVHHVVLGRYALPLLPAALMAVTMAFVWGEDALRARLRWWPRAFLPLATAAAWFFAGPLPWTVARPNQFPHHAFLHYEPHRLFEAGGLQARLHRVPQVYQWLSVAPPESVTIAEIPWQYEFPYNPYLIYQLLHRQRLVVGAVHDLAETSSPPFPRDDPTLRWRWLAHVSDLPGLRARGVRYLIVHTDLAGELPQEHFLYRPNVDKVVEYLDANVGPPIHDDGAVKTYDLLAPRAR